MTLRHSSKATTERMSLRRSQLPLINGENGTRPSTSSPNGRARRKRRVTKWKKIRFVLFIC